MTFKMPVVLLKDLITKQSRSLETNAQYFSLRIENEDDGGWEVLRDDVIDYCESLFTHFIFQKEADEDRTSSWWFVVGIA